MTHGVKILGFGLERSLFRLVFEEVWVFGLGVTIVESVLGVSARRLVTIGDELDLSGVFITQDHFCFVIFCRRRLLRLLQ